MNYHQSLLVTALEKINDISTLAAKSVVLVSENELLTHADPDFRQKKKTNFDIFSDIFYGTKTLLVNQLGASSVVKFGSFEDESVISHRWKTGGTKVTPMSETLCNARKLVV